MKRFISTHTLRGERDKSIKLLCFVFNIFQLTRSVGSVTCLDTDSSAMLIFQLTRSVGSVTAYSQIIRNGRGDFNSHAPWGA